MSTKKPLETLPPGKIVNMKKPVSAVIASVHIYVAPYVCGLRSVRVLKEARASFVRGSFDFNSGTLHYQRVSHNFQETL